MLIASANVNFAPNGGTKHFLMFVSVWQHKYAVPKRICLNFEKEKKNCAVSLKMALGLTTIEGVRKKI